MAGQGPRLSTWALQTFVLKKKKKILQHELRPAACRRKGLWPSELGGAGSRSHHPGAGALTRPIRFRAGREGAGSAQARWRPPAHRGAGAAPRRQAGPPSRPRGTPHVSASLCAPPAPRQPLSAAGAQGECLRASASVRGPSEGVSGFPEALRLTEEDEPPDFHSAALRGLLLQRWSSVSTPVGAGPARFAPSLLLLPVSRGRLYVLSYRTPVQPVFGWSSRLTVCKFSCNFDVLKGETSTMFTASAILTGTF